MLTTAQMLRVLTLSTLYPDAMRPNFGVFVEQQTRGLAAHPDIDLTVVAGLGVPPWPLSKHRNYRAFAALPTQERWNGVAIHRPRFTMLPGTVGRFHAAALARAATRVIDPLYAVTPFDVIDAEFFFPDGPAAIALGKRYGIPVSIKARGADIHHWGRSPATATQVRDAARRADGILAVSEALADDIAALGVDRSKVTVHRTGIDRGLFAVRDRAAAKAALSIAGPLVVSLGALIPRKGHAIVIDAVARLPGVTLAVIGQGPEQAALAARIAASGAANRIRLIGSVPHAQLPQWMNAADIMALASSSEGLANAWVEALASSTPIVIPDAGGAREIVKTPAAGRIVERNASAFAHALAEILASPPPPADTAATVSAYSWETNRDQLYAHLSGLAGM
jgi:teichuronic acid biosynthesis glycosyltransferase TuaC